MTTHADRNFSFTDPTCQDGDTFERCNLSQLQPHTAIFAGRSGLTFRACNLVNCDVPAGSVVIRCNTCQVSRCSHLHPEWPLPIEVEDCPHVVERNEVAVDGATVAVDYVREDTVL